MNIDRFRVISVIFLLSALTASACTSTATPGTPSATAALPTSLTIVVPAEPPTLDSLRESSGPVRNTVSANILETLATLDPSTNKILPNLAMSWNQTGPMTWRVTLRTGVKFHDGSTMTADDAVASLKYTLTKGSTIKDTLIPQFADAQKVDASTIDISLSVVDPIFPIQLQFVSIAPASAVAKGNDFMAASPIGSGPYKVVQWSKGTSLTLTRFDDYWGGPPQIKDVTILWRTEPIVRAGMVRTGEAQLVQSLTASSIQDVPKIASVGGLDAYILQLNTIGQTQGSVMQDIRVRQAVNYAIDRVALRDKVYGGYATLLKGNMVAPIVLGYNTSLEDYPYDPAKAKALIQDAGVAGKPVTFICSGGRFINDGEACQFITAQLNEVGLKVTMTNPTFADWLVAYRNGPNGLNRPDILWGGPGNSSLDFPSGTALVYVRSRTPQGGGALTLNDPNLDTLVASAQSEADLTKRAATSQQIAKILRDQAYLAVLLSPNYIWGTAKNLDFKPRTDDYLYLKNVRYTN